MVQFFTSTIIISGLLLKSHVCHDMITLSKRSYMEVTPLSELTCSAVRMTNMMLPTSGEYIQARDETIYSISNKKDK